jgi:hypothetical protein
LPATAVTSMPEQVERVVVDVDRVQAAPPAWMPPATLRLALGERHLTVTVAPTTARGNVAAGRAGQVWYVP